MSEDAATTADDTSSRRVTMARERVAAATAAVEAAQERMTRSAPTDGRRRRALAVSVAVTVVLAIVAVVAGLVLHAGGGPGPADGVVASASTAVATVLTADPAHPDRYVDAVRSVSGGDYRRRIDRAAPAIEAAVAALGSPGTGQVVAAGALGAIPAEGPADVLVVAEATAPQLVGGAAGDRRIVLTVTMIRESGRWVIGGVTAR
ncbi:hypothetical protein ACXVUM_02605 [Williamsia sp. SKLECPSW1]